MLAIMRARKKCRLPTCETFKLQRFGLCNKHRKWVEKGHMTEDLVIIKKIRELDPKRNCKMSDCTRKHKGFGFCYNHYGMYKRKTISLSGERLKPVIRYGDDFQCIVCGNTGKIAKGFCKKHYSLFRSGRIDYDGRELRKPKRVRRYTEFDRCKMSGCNIKARYNWFCQKHGEQEKRGTIDSKGNRLVPKLFKNRGSICLKCEKPAHCKGLCVFHYNRMRTGYGTKWINKGKTCGALGCSRPAYCRQRCTMHYGRLKAMWEREEAKKTLLPGNAGRSDKTTLLQDAR